MASSHAHMAPSLSNRQQKKKKKRKICCNQLQQQRSQFIDECHLLPTATYVFPIPVQVLLIAAAAVVVVTKETTSPSTADN